MSLSDGEQSGGTFRTGREGGVFSSALAFREFKVRVGLPSFRRDTHKAKQGTTDLEAVDRADCVLTSLGKCVLAGVCFHAGFFSYS